MEMERRLTSGRTGDGEFSSLSPANHRNQRW
jgi:hypothetical protein